MNTYHLVAKIKPKHEVYLSPEARLTVQSDREEAAAELVAQKLIEKLEVQVSITRPEVWETKSISDTGREYRQTQDNDYFNSITVSPRYTSWRGRALGYAWLYFAGMASGSILGAGVVVLAIFLTSMR